MYNKEKQIKWQKNNKDKMRLASRRFYKRNREKRIIEAIKLANKRIKSWEVLIPKQTICQVCGEKIYFNCGNLTKAIHFDHRKGGKEKIIRNPTNWLRQHSMNPVNEKIWLTCNFGMLCRKCNSRLPTSNRKKFVLNINKYVNQYVS